MGLGESILLAVVDKLLIGIGLLIAGLWLNARLELVKGQIGLQNALAQSRATAFGVLWESTALLTPRGDDVPTEDACNGAFAKIREWYYSGNGAMHLSFAATGHCLGLLEALERRDSAAARKRATALRTQLKVDIGVYTKAQAKAPLVVSGFRSA